MRMILALLVMCSLVFASTASADQSTAPGQQKKAAGDGSAKEYAPGQQKAEEAEAEAKAKKKTEKAKKSGAGKPEATAEELLEEEAAGKTKAKGKAK